MAFSRSRAFNTAKGVPARGGVAVARASWNRDCDRVLKHARCVSLRAARGTSSLRGARRRGVVVVVSRMAFRYRLGTTIKKETYEKVAALRVVCVRAY